MVTKFDTILAPCASNRLAVSATRSGSDLTPARPWSVHFTKVTYVGMPAPSPRGPSYCCTAPRARARRAMRLPESPSRIDRSDPLSDLEVTLDRSGHEL